jgi:hypothetical protein
MCDGLLMSASANDALEKTSAEPLDRLVRVFEYVEEVACGRWKSD